MQSRLADVAQETAVQLWQLQPQTRNDFEVGLNNVVQREYGAVEGVPHNAHDRLGLHPWHLARSHTNINKGLD